MLGEYTRSQPIVRYNQNGMQEAEDDVATEYPLTLMLDGEEFATIVCTPSDLEDMVIGFLAAEGVIRFPEQIRKLVIDQQGGFAYVDTNIKWTASHNDGMKRIIGSCCGKSRHFYFQNDVQTAKTITTSLHISAEDCFHYMRLLQNHSDIFTKTGGVHNAALCGMDRLIAIRTDIGRHNALDKIYGYCLKRRVPLSDKLIAFSGRVSSEVVLKISKIGVGIVLSKSAPTDLALKLAHDLHVTVVGFIRHHSFNVYTHPHRIVDRTFRGGVYDGHSNHLAHR